MQEILYWFIIKAILTKVINRLLLNLGLVSIYTWGFVNVLKLPFAAAVSLFNVPLLGLFQDFMSSLLLFVPYET